MTKRKGHNFNQDLCIQYIDSAFKGDIVMSSVITSSDATLVEGSRIEEGDV